MTIIVAISVMTIITDVIDLPADATPGLPEAAEMRAEDAALEAARRTLRGVGSGSLRGGFAGSRGLL